MIEYETSDPNSRLAREREAADERLREAEAQAAAVAKSMGEVDAILGRFDAERLGRIAERVIAINRELNPFMADRLMRCHLQTSPTLRVLMAEFISNHGEELP